MNRINNDWSNMLQMANEDLAKNDAKLEVMEDEEGYYSLYVTMKGKTKCFAENYFEDELGELINEAWAHAKAGSQPKTVWIIHFNDVAEFATLPHEIEAFWNYQDAKKRFDDMVSDAKSDTSWGEWWIEDESETSYETYPDGEWGTDHYAVYLEEVKVN